MDAIITYILTLIYCMFNDGSKKIEPVHLENQVFFKSENSVLGHKFGKFHCC